LQPFLHLSELLWRDSHLAQLASRERSEKAQYDFFRPRCFYDVRVTVLELIQRSAEFLTRKGVENPRLNAELLLAHVLTLPRMRLYLEFERVVPDPQVDQYRELVKRRGTREPLQHITGTANFCGLEFVVNRNVLVPRPETELLAEQGWTFLKSRPEPAALDFGTGSGCLAVLLAVRCPSATVWAMDISSEALEVARGNAGRHQVADRIRFCRAGGLDALDPRPPVDLILTNPPYIPSADIATLDPEVRDFDPRLALDGGVDGLDWYRHLATQGRTLLKPGGKLMAEFGDGQAEGIGLLFEKQNWVVEGVLEDYTRRPRILLARAET
jgi:release factor glutamine methyltransferase